MPNTEPVLTATGISSVITSAFGGSLAAVDSNHQLVIALVTAGIAVLQNVAGLVARSKVSPVVEKIAEYISEEDWNRIIRGGDTASTAQN